MSEPTFQIKFGQQIYRNLKFEDACKLVESHTAAERKAHDDLKKKVEEDNH